MTYTKYIFFSRSGRFSLSSIWVYLKKKMFNNDQKKKKKRKRRSAGRPFSSSSSNKAVIVSDVFTRLGFHRLRRVSRYLIYIYFALCVVVVVVLPGRGEPYVSVPGALLTRNSAFKGVR